MRFHAKHALAALAIAGTALFAVQSLHAQQATEKKAPPAEAGGMDPAMMAKMMQLAQPGKPHQELAKRVGKWDTKYKIRMAPDMPWMEFSGTMETKPLLGGRYVMEESSFEMMGMPMQGVSITGFDNLTQEYTSIWMDSMSTWSITSRGKKTADGTLEFKGTMVDVAGSRPFRMVEHEQADGSIDVEMYDTIPPKGDTQVMTIHATKKP